MNVTTNKRRCRCCYAQGTFKDLISSYLWLGESEVYGDILKECFNVHLINVADVESSGICDLCILTLRNANKFRNRVLQSEQLFKKYISEAKRTVKLESVVNNDNDLDNAENADNAETGQDPETVKFECEISDDEAADNDESEQDSEPAKKSVKLESAVSDADYGEPDQDPVPDYIDNNFAEIDVPIKAEVNIETEVRKKKRKRKVKYDSDASEKNYGQCVRRKKKDKVFESATPERKQHRVNLTSILQFSNASPFRDKKAKGFSCLYCCKYFKCIDDLRYHTAQQSEKDKLNLMIDYKLSYNPIKIDITDLQCTICDMEVNDLADLKEHLVTVHNKVIHSDIKDIILPFRLEDGNNYKCVICEVVHVSFKNLYLHMSSHYRNYCCNICGAGYITIAALRKHGKTHENGSFPCDYCSKIFTSLNKKRQHERGVHMGGWLRNKCPYCPQTFVSYYDKSEHLVKAHNETPIIYPCNACDKIYKKKFELNKHIKHHHLLQKNYKCDVCGAKYFSKKGLMEHVLRHEGDGLGERYTCEICGKKFWRVRTLNEHMKVHDGRQEQFECEICKKVFHKKCSLKSHIRLHQEDLDIFKEFDDVKHLIDNRDISLKQIAAENRMRETVADNRMRETETLSLTSL